ncbi:MarR family transcriptional regulator [Ectobacillus sp. JY-23]|uniref:MarR family winged helix-turn-helix transcriptional regulator n=1 Tax=Ectobacillus sp. JY-23 TaxID=2933872 RepID=UPI001FF6CE92|nr:MarR family transcriptional regulator [Ectobacillus sp. JY-23]UOY92645.1 MarR family transcriptional regulator [Ectobacillus sp. JY-23]
MSKYKKEEISLSLKVFIGLSRVHRALMNISNESAQENELNPTEFAVLELLYHKGSQPLQQIGEKILIASGSITYVVDKLEKKGLVLRRPCTYDRRVIFADLTTEGTKLMETIFPIHEVKLHESLAMLTAAEKEQLLQLLKKVGKYYARM